jgi:putative chitinase
MIQSEHPGGLRIMQITEDNLKTIMPNARSQAGVFVSALNSAMTRRHIDSPKRIAAFLAQVGHESGQLQYVRELGNNQYLSKYDTGTLALRLGNTPEADGDGQKYRSRADPDHRAQQLSPVQPRPVRR